MSSQSRLKMELGESIFTLRAIRRFKSIPIPDRDNLHILEAAIRAPRGGNQGVLLSGPSGAPACLQSRQLRGE